MLHWDIEPAGGAGSSELASRLAFLQEDSTFWNLTFCTLCRYDALFGPGHKDLALNPKPMT